KHQADHRVDERMQRPPGLGRQDRNALGAVIAQHIGQGNDTIGLGHSFASPSKANLEFNNAGSTTLLRSRRRLRCSFISVSISSRIAVHWVAPATSTSE